MTKISTQPVRFPGGPMDWSGFSAWWVVAARDIFRRMDMREETQDPPYGRTATLPTIVGYIAETGRARDYRLLQPIQTANRNSVQSASGILTATSNATTSTINIASHSVRQAGESGAVDIAYNSGSVTGLVPSTVYLMYADDPSYQGGAVSFLATTNPDNLIALGRYYVGEIRTPVAATARNISAATSANPIEFTTSAVHGWSNSDTVSFAGLPGDFGTNLNGNSYVITYVSTTQFTIAINGGGYAAYTTGGTATRVSTGSTGGGGGGGGSGDSRWGGNYSIP